MSGVIVFGADPVGVGLACCPGYYLVNRWAVSDQTHALSIGMGQIIRFCLDPFFEVTRVLECKILTKKEKKKKKKLVSVPFLVNQLMEQTKLDGLYNWDG